MRYLHLLLVLIALGGCKRSATAEDPSTEPAASAPVASPPVVETEERAAAFRSIKAELRKRLAADRAVSANKLGYEQAIAKHESEIKQAGMSKRIPTEPLDLSALKESVRLHAEKNALSLETLELAAAEPSSSLPTDHPGTGPYPYTLDQMFDRFPVKLVVTPPSEGRLKSFFAGLKSAIVPSLDLVAVRLDAERATFSGYVYRRLDITPPRHTPPALSVEAAAAAAGVEVPKGHPRLGEASALVEEHRVLAPELKEALIVLGRVHLLGLQKRFFHQRVEAIDKRSFPRPVGAKRSGEAGRGTGAKP